MTRRRRLALWLAEWLRHIAFRLDLATAPKGPPPSVAGITDEEWERFYAAVRGDAADRG